MIVQKTSWPWELRRTARLLVAVIVSVGAAIGVAQAIKGAPGVATGIGVAVGLALVCLKAGERFDERYYLQLSTSRVEGTEQEPCQNLGG